MTDLHCAIRNRVGDNAALVMSFDALRGLLLNNFVHATKYLPDQSIPIEGFSKVGARFTRLELGSWKLKICRHQQDSNVTVEVTPGFTVTVALHLMDDKNLEFSKIHIKVTNLRFLISANAPNLHFGTPDFDVIGQIVPSCTTRAKALREGTVEEIDVERIEGAMAYVTPRRVVESVLSTVSTIDLTERFTAFDLRGDWKLEVVENNLVIRPSHGISLRERVGCPIMDSVENFSTTASALKPIDDTHYSWRIVHEGVLIW